MPRLRPFETPLHNRASTEPARFNPHKRSNPALVLDAQERVLAWQRFANDRDGYRQLKRFVRTYPDRTWAVEGARGVGPPWRASTRSTCRPACRPGSGRSAVAAIGQMCYGALCWRQAGGRCRITRACSNETSALTSRANMPATRINPYP